MIKARITAYSSSRNHYDPFGGYHDCSFCYAGDLHVSFVALCKFAWLFEEATWF